MARAKVEKPSHTSTVVATRLGTKAGHRGDAPALRAGFGGLVARVRGRHLLGADLVAIAGGAYAALCIRLDQLVGPETLVGWLPALVILLGIRSVTNTRLGLYSRHWRSASMPDIARIGAAGVTGTVVAAGLFYVGGFVTGIDWAPGLPRSFWAIELFITTALTGGTRFALRAASELAVRRRRQAAAPPRAAILYGAGETGAVIARSTRRHPEAGVEPVAFLDDDPALAGAVVSGLRVFGGVEAMDAAARLTGADTLLVTMPSASGGRIRAVLEAALALGLTVRTVPAIQGLLDGSVDASRLRAVRVEDLLARPIVSDHAHGVEALIRGRVVMITGAGGSIGSELARQVFAIGPERLVLLDRAESPLYLVQQELETRRRHAGRRTTVVVRLVNVASREAVARTVRLDRPNVIFHAAAYKQVPLMEQYPSDAVHVNIGGTLALLDAAVEALVDRFVFVSTDKAVRPSSAMGASKRIAEMLVADTARRTGRSYVSVRFGNVLGSAGSVVPIFQWELENGEPLTITDPEMTRFFMTIPEAAWLILDAAALGHDGDLFVLDMGEQVRVMDVARDLVRLAGRDPDAQPVEIVGLRPGEKLHEELFYDAERAEPTASPKVLRVLGERTPDGIRDRAATLLALATGRDEPLLYRELLAAVRVANGSPGAPVVAGEPVAVATGNVTPEAPTGRSSGREQGGPPEPQPAPTGPGGG